MSSPSSSGAAAAAAAIPIKARILSAIRGAFCADAASMGTHWTYNPAEMRTLVPSIEAPEFKMDPEPTPKFYSSTEFPGHYGPGMLSPYGEQMKFVTESSSIMNMASSSSSSSVVSIDGDAVSKEMLAWATSFGGRPDSALNEFVKNMNKPDGSGQWPNCGADDYQAHIYMKVVPIVSRYAGQPDLLEKVTTAVRVHQNNDMAVAFAKASARILEAVLLGENDLNQVLETCQANIRAEKEDSDNNNKETDSVLKAFDDAKRFLEQSTVSSETTTTETTKFPDLDSVLLELSNEMMKEKPDSPFYNLAARSCALPGAFIGPLYLFLKASSSSGGGKYYGNDKTKWYEQALRENILASGDTCSRAIFIGAVFGALAENDGVPQSWTSRMHQETLSFVESAAESIANAATASTNNNNDDDGSQTPNSEL